MEYSISEIATIIAGEGSIPQPQARISVLLTDSRSLTWPSSSLFFALRTMTGDGHRYIDELYEQGVRNFVVDES